MAGIWEWSNPNSFRIGPPKANSNPIAPTQKQHSITTTTITMIQGFVFCGAEGGGSEVSVVSAMNYWVVLKMAGIEIRLMPKSGRMTNTHIRHTPNAMLM
jgi:hypothetical protein